MQWQLIKLYWHELRLRKKKTALITFAIAWGTVSILLLMSFGRGLSQAGTKAFKGLSDNIIMVSSGQTSKPYQGLPRGRRIRLYIDDVDLLKRMVPEIRQIGAESNNSHTVSYGTKASTRNVCGVYPNFGEMRSQIADAGGRFINENDQTQVRRVAFLGWTAAEALFGHENPVGKQIAINRSPFTVIGVMKKKQQMGSYNGPDHEMIYIPFATFSQIDAQRFVDRIHIQPRDKRLSIFVEDRVRHILGAKYRFADDDAYALNFWNTIKNGDVMTTVFVGIEVFMTLIGALTLLIGAVGVTNLMYAIVKERTREIGVKMAIGARRRHIVFQFFLETLLIFSKGMIWGTLIAYVLVMGVRQIPVSYENFSMQSFLMRPIFSLDILLIFLLLMGILVFFSGIFPAMRASRQSPIEALRYE
jgi:putative ABC transport system permease protein